ncbi:hypothetical protein [Candidatus Ichthyocystis sparus]|uniref:hypothetical protein n=1 Tax=Candidatus Ichthyocystis sparus TaxID=1561004 RepID=UPI000B854062|nr:hypothetical protein [Candidatus Ichthyocystis sparus]
MAEENRNDQALASQLLNKQKEKELLHCELGKEISYVVPTCGSCVATLNSNEATVQVLVNSVKAHTLAAAVTVEGVDSWATKNQAHQW